jgi:hypothetical protein
MTRDLTHHQMEIITDLFHAVDGQARVFVAADTLYHSPLYWLAHECRALIALHKEKRNGKAYRHIALTEKGVLWCEQHGIYAREPLDEALMPQADPRTRKTIAFQLPIGDRAVGLIEGCKEKRAFVPVIRLAMELYAAIGYEAFMAMVKEHGQLLETLQQARREIEIENKRLELERKALEAQTLEVAQFHNYFKSIDAKLSQLQTAPQAPEKGQISALQPVQGIRAIGSTVDVPMPIFDDEDDLLDVVADVGAGKRVSENFLKSIGALNP